MRILMVCLGNICRSPIAEGLMKDKILKNKLDWTVDSAGTESYHIGEAPHQFSQKICLSNNVDISMQRARKFVKEDLQRFDKIYAMAGDVYQEIKNITGKGADLSNVDYFLNELEGINQSVPDPWYGPEAGYKQVYDLIDRACDAIIKKYK
ncbi:MAG: low molecular weight phosphotyrosine protein phosphatase [Flavipsychrobacter sp.]|nr:low molecular weight phosphotyrosine protein phosphatase [Flavipsychrobacter sp.]